MDTMTCAGLALGFDDVIICERKWMPTRIQLKFLGWTKRQHLSQAATWTAQQKWIHVNPFGHVSRSLSLLMLAEHDKDWHCNPSIAWVWMVFPLRVYEAGDSERNSPLLLLQDQQTSACRGSNQEDAKLLPCLSKGGRHWLPLHIKLNFWYIMFSALSTLARQYRSRRHLQGKTVKGKEQFCCFAEPDAAWLRHQVSHSCATFRSILGQPARRPQQLP